MKKIDKLTMAEWLTTQYKEYINSVDEHNIEVDRKQKQLESLGIQPHTREYYEQQGLLEEGYLINKLNKVFDSKIKITINGKFKVDGSKIKLNFYDDFKPLEKQVSLQFGDGIQGRVIILRDINKVIEKLKELGIN